MARPTMLSYASASSLAEEMVESVSNRSPRDFETTMKRVQRDLAYGSTWVNKKGTVVSRHMKLYMRRRWGYCTSCVDIPVQLYEHVNSVLNPVWMARRPRTAPNECFNGICLVCHPSAKKNAEIDSQWKEKIEQGDFDFATPNVIDFANTTLVDLPSKRKLKSTSHASALVSPVKSAVANYAAQDTSHRLFVSPKPSGLSRVFQSQWSYERESEHLRNFFHGLQDPKIETALEPEKLSFNSSQWTPISTTPYNEQAKNIHKRIPRNPRQFSSEKLNWTQADMYVIMGRNKTTCEPKLKEKRGDIRDDLDSIFAAARYRVDVAKSPTLLRSVELDPLFMKVSLKAWKNGKDLQSSYNTTDGDEKREGVSCMNSHGDIPVGSLRQDSPVSVSKSRQAPVSLHSTLRNPSDKWRDDGCHKPEEHNRRQSTISSLGSFTEVDGHVYNPENKGDDNRHNRRVRFADDVFVCEQRNQMPILAPSTLEPTFERYALSTPETVSTEAGGNYESSNCVMDHSKKQKIDAIIANLKSLIDDVPIDVSIGPGDEEVGFKLVISSIANAMREHSNVACVQAFCIWEITQICEADSRFKLLVARSGIFGDIVNAMVAFVTDDEVQEVGSATIRSLAEVHEHIK